MKQWRRNQIVLFLGLGLLALLSVAFVGGLWVGALTAMRNQPRRGRGPLPLLDEAWNHLAAEFYGELPDTPIRNRGAIRGLLASLEDPYTLLLDPEPAREEQDRLSGVRGSIGVSLNRGEEGVVFLMPFANGPAAVAGVRAGDRLNAIDGLPVAPGSDLGMVSEMLEGAVGSSVDLALTRANEAEELKVRVVRAEFTEPSVEAYILDQEDGIGYLRIRLFTVETSEEVRRAIFDLLQRGARSIVLDLRGNGGGTLAGLDVVGGMFLPEGSILYYEINNDGKLEVLTSGRQIFTGRLSVLVDGGTASAAEILAGALRDHGRAEIIGSQTFGKGSVQALHSLRDGSVLHVTLALWLTPSQLGIDGVGLVPDNEVTPLADIDAALEAALALLGDEPPE